MVVVIEEVVDLMVEINKVVVVLVEAIYIEDEDEVAVQKVASIEQDEVEIEQMVVKTTNAYTSTTWRIFLKNTPKGDTSERIFSTLGTGWIRLLKARQRVLHVNQL